MMMTRTARPFTRIASSRGSGAVWATLVATLCLATTASSADRPHALNLPSDHRTEVITLDFVPQQPQRDASQQPQLSIAADGTVRIRSRFAGEKGIVGRLTEQQLDALLQTIVIDQHFFEQDSQQLAAVIAARRDERGQSPHVRGADTTVIRLRLKGQTHTVSCRALGVAANQCPDSAEVQRMFASQRSLENIMAIVEAGGSRRATQMLEQANQALKTEHGQVTPFTLGELTSTQRMPNGGYYMQFSRIPKPETHTRHSPSVLIVSVFDAPGSEPHVNVTASLPPVSADSRPVLR